MADIIQLPTVFCLLVDFPNTNIDCAIASDKPYEEVCFGCRRPGKFLTGDIIEDHASPGHVICSILWVLIVIIGLFATFANILIITIVKKHKQPRAFDFMLTILASCDLISSFMAVVSSTAMVIFYEGINRGPVTLFLYYVPFLICLVGRSGSVYVTVLITIERYLVITFPLKSNSWFTPLKTKLTTFGVILLAVLVNVPRFTSLIISQNVRGKNVNSLLNLTYIIRATDLEVFWYDTIGSIHYKIDIWSPFPILIIFNILLFIEIRKFTTKRTEISQKMKRDIRAARMFVPVVIILFICNIEPITHYIFLEFHKVYYRELVMGMALSVVLNAAANLPIYYARGSSFREEIRAGVANLYSKKNFLNKNNNNRGKTSREISSATGNNRNDSASAT